MTRLGVIYTRHGRLTSVLLAAALASLAVLGFASQALAGKPTGEFANFSDCPLSNPEVTACVYALTTGGEFKIGSTTVPITKTMTLQGGIIGPTNTFVDAADGNTLSKTPQTVPGGLLKIVAPEFFPEFLRVIFNEFINKGVTGVTASTELVGEVGWNLSNAINKEGPAITLPVRVHLENSFLGPKCYIGSKANPITLALTTGTTSPPPPNMPITGSGGERELRAGGALIVARKTSLVNNEFSAPGAEGCGSQILFGLFTGLIDGAVDSESGVPSPAGHNTAILNGSEELGAAAAVKASEG
jgi:hypothetical protein